jgi:hypothetical protein
VTLQATIEFPKRRQLFHREVTTMGQAGVQHSAGMTLGEDQSVTIGPVGIGRIDPQVVEVERDQNLRD